MSLDPITLLLIEQNIASQPCSVCGGPSTRMKSRLRYGTAFYCDAHLPVNQRENRYKYTIPLVKDHSPR